MIDGIGSANQRLLDHVTSRNARYLKDQLEFFPWRRPCTVRALLVTDGGLDFGDGDFGLSTLVDILVNDGRSYVRFDLTLAHLSPNVSNSAVMAGAPGVSRSIKGFHFNNPSHFAADMYDEVWLFGIETNYHSAFYPSRDSQRATYPADSLGDAELRALGAHMNSGRGVFATGDHGYLGYGLCHAVTRVRSMRHWAPFAGPGGLDEVSMVGARRNDTNQIGYDAGSQFSDQSDDIPQPLDLTLYSTRMNALTSARYPHPLLCSRLGRIDVFPDHPHEGECRIPASLADTYLDGTPEYPPATDGSGVLSPEIVARGRVPAGNTASAGGNTSLKDPTQAHSFPVISAYDGHRAGIGRVVCDSTWHHFINVNLIGVVEGGGFDDFNYPGHPGTPGTHLSKHIGFLYSPAGRAALDKIREYFVNIGVWIAPNAKHECFNSTLWWDLLWSDRLVEATMLNPDSREVGLRDLFHIGVHARDVIGRKAGACQSLYLMIDIFRRLWPEILPWIDPWGPVERERALPLPVTDLQPVIDVALGNGLVAARREFPYPGEDVDSERLAQAVLEGAKEGLARGFGELRKEIESVQRVLG